MMFTLMEDHSVKGEQWASMEASLEQREACIHFSSPRPHASF
jgi:hypothetical protein